MQSLRVQKKEHMLFYIIEQKIQYNLLMYTFIIYKYLIIYKICIIHFNVLFTNCYIVQQLRAFSGYTIYPPNQNISY